MGNMSYCRFENTSRDLWECYEHITDDDLSEDEKKGRREIVQTCIDILEALGYKIDSSDEFFTTNYAD